MDCGWEGLVGGYIQVPLSLIREVAAKVIEVIYGQEKDVQ